MSHFKYKNYENKIILSAQQMLNKEARECDTRRNLEWKQTECQASKSVWVFVL